MALKTFNVDEETYKQFSRHCKENGISMSKKIENFIRKELEELGKSPVERKIGGKPVKEKMLKYCG